MTIRSRLLPLFALVALFAASPARADVVVEAFFGTSFNVPMSLTVVQSGYPDISFTAHYDTRPTEPRIYYAIRVSFWNDKTGWLIEELHHKIYLTNPTPEVSEFEVSHGYNIITVDRGWRRGSNNILLFGGGVVLGYPHSTIRGQQWPEDSGYQLGGAAVQGGAGHRFEVLPHVFLSVEGKLTAAWARMPVVNGHANVPNLAAHVLVGVGGKF